MIFSGGKNLEVEYTHNTRAGTNWIVRVYRRTFLLRRLVASDWFLNEEQARRFAESLATELRAGAPLDDIRKRTPGWTLHRPRPRTPEK